MRQLTIHILGDIGHRIVAESAAVVAELGHRSVAGPPADLAIAPRLTRKLPPAEIHAYRLGVLVFHPSLLPRHRGPDAVRQAVAAGEAFTGVTWFWADDGLDTGPVCEQEIAAVGGLEPGELYHGRLVPAGMTALRRALACLAVGLRRAVDQPAEAATYESFLPKPARDSRAMRDSSAPARHGIERS